MNAVSSKIKQSTFLIVDDVNAMLTATGAVLNNIGAGRIVTASNGVDALKILRRVPVTMVVSDWDMPTMSGLELLMEIRADKQLNSLPFVMYTAKGSRERVQQAIAAGVSELLIAPYTSASLTDRIERGLRWIPNKTAKKTQSPDSSAKNAERSTLLIVDDTPDNLYLLTELLKDEYRIRVAQDGLKALKICYSDNPPDLVLLDVMMPDMDGFEVAQKMREHPNSETIPVIFVTAMTGDDARSKGLDLGAIDFVNKPIDPDILKARVRNFMRYVQLHKQLQADYDYMRDTVQLQDDVKQITRHDIKKPLAGIIDQLQSLAADSSMSVEHKRKLRKLEETVLEVLDITNLSTELFKIETGRFKLDPKPVNIHEVLKRLIAIATTSFATKRLTIAINADIAQDGVIPQAQGDAMLCYSVFQNLIGNACEIAAADSKVTIMLQSNNPLRIAIKCKGVIPLEIRDRFFDKFVNLNEQEDLELGAYSAKILTQAQGGDVALAVSDSDKSSVFIVTLPLHL